MNKIGPKSVRVPSASQGKILYCENDSNTLSSQAKVFEQAGYTVERTQGRREAEQALRTGSYDVVVLGHTLSRDDRHHLPYMAKKGHDDTQVLVLHASGRHHAVDIAIDSREGDEAVLQAIATLVHQKAMAVAV
jgi:DNA-binding NtrC family response regulator